MGLPSNLDRLVEIEMLHTVNQERELGGINQAAHYFLLFIRGWDGGAGTIFGQGDPHLDPNSHSLGSPRTAYRPRALEEEVHFVVGLISLLVGK